MADRKALEAVDRSFRDATNISRPFGGKIMILGGDFRQVLPVVVNGTRAQIINASIVQSYLWSHVRILSLTENMRAKHDIAFSEYLLRVGNGTETTTEAEMIRIPDTLGLLWEGEHSITDLITVTFPNLYSHVGDKNYMRDRAILTPLNEHVNMLNDITVGQLPGEEVIYYSYDSVSDDTRNFYQPEFLNTLTPGNLPPHKLKLKVGAPIMLLRNIDQKIGLCNGTRLMCRRFAKNVIEAEILTGQFEGNSVFLPRIPLNTAEDIKLPFQLTPGMGAVNLMVFLVCAHFYRYNKDFSRVKEDGRTDEP
ncbi:hypothetical protein KSP39_PZI015390 [Platanthera zijinensis]|uniref:ATP-dependent DNA helicase n=1 Tax=Platanthera zijinensis TaxID=2320716 RepID=A0AAP0G203_9ASPA